MTMTITCSTMTGHLFDTIIVALTDNEVYSIDPSTCMYLKRTVISHLENYNMHNIYIKYKCVNVPFLQARPKKMQVYQK